MRWIAIGLVGALGVAFVATPTTASAQVSEEVAAQFEAGHAELENGRKIPYRRMRPAPEAGAGPHPLVVFLHGAGERGDDNATQLIHVPEQMATGERRARFPCTLLAVQVPAGEVWSAMGLGSERFPEPSTVTDAMSAVEQLIERMRSEPKIDANRIYLTGLSMGGFGAWDLGARRAEWFAAVAPICGGGDPTAAAGLRDVPVFAVHGPDDPVVSVERSRVMVEALREVGGEVQLWEPEGSGHASWVPAFQEDRLLEWMFAQRRSTAARAEAIQPTPALTLPESTQPGLRRRVSAGNFDRCPNFANLTIESEEFGLTPALGPDPGRELYAMQFDGYLFVPETASWTFVLASDDGSRLWVDEELIVNNDGLHGTVRLHGFAALEAGWHRFRLEYFNKTGGAALEFALRRTGRGRAEDPVFCHETPEGAPR